MGKWKAIALWILFLSFSSPLGAMDDDQRTEFERIANLGMAGLTAEAVRAFDAKYSEEDWSKYDYPDYVESDPSVAVAYRIAAMEPELLGNPGVGLADESIPCYCFCEKMGHRTLLHCFWKDGIAGGQFDDHGASCNICYGQAMLAFLWSELGAATAEIREGMERKFDWLIEKHGRE